MTMLQLALRPRDEEVAAQTAEVSRRLMEMLAGMNADAYPAVLAMAQAIGTVALATGNADQAAGLLRQVADSLEGVAALRERPGGGLH